MARVRLIRARKIQRAQQLTVPIVRQATAHIGRMAHALAPRGTHFSGSGRRKRGKTLVAALYSQMRVNQRYVLGRVGANVKHALTAHQGSRPHVIRSRGSELLKFQWDRGNLLMERRGRGRRQFFFFPRVRHPGNRRPVRYLTTPLTLVAGRLGFMVFGMGRGRQRLP